MFSFWEQFKKPVVSAAKGVSEWFKGIPEKWREAKETREEEDRKQIEMIPREPEEPKEPLTMAGLFKPITETLKPVTDIFKPMAEPFKPEGEIGVAKPGSALESLFKEEKPVPEIEKGIDTWDIAKETVKEMWPTFKGMLGLSGPTFRQITEKDVAWHSLTYEERLKAFGGEFGKNLKEAVLGWPRNAIQFIATPAIGAVEEIADVSLGEVPLPTKVGEWIGPLTGTRTQVDSFMDQGYTYEEAQGLVIAQQMSRAYSFVSFFGAPVYIESLIRRPTIEKVYEVKIPPTESHTLATSISKSAKLPKPTSETAVRGTIGQYGQVVRIKGHPNQYIIVDTVPATGAKSYFSFEISDPVLQLQASAFSKTFKVPEIVAPAGVKFPTYNPALPGMTTWVTTTPLKAHTAMLEESLLRIAPTITKRVPVPTGAVPPLQMGMTIEDVSKGKPTVPEKAETEAEAKLKFDFVHYTPDFNLKDITKRGLISSEKGTMGEGVYFWVSSKGMTAKDIEKDEIALRINPEFASELISEDILEEGEKGQEFILDKITPKYLQVLKGDKWESLVEEKVKPVEVNLKEAKKYKSAEEFVESQELLFHGTNKKFDVFDDSLRGSVTGAKSAEGAIWFTDNQRVAKGYSLFAAEDAPVKNILEQAAKAEKVAQKSGKESDWLKYDALVKKSEEIGASEASFARRKDAVIREAYIQGDLYEVDANGKTPQELSADGSIDSWLNQQLEIAKKLNKDGVKITNLDDAAGLTDVPSTHYAIFDAKNIKIKQQLTEIYNQATKEVKPVEVNLTEVKSELPIFYNEFGHRVSRSDINEDMLPILDAIHTKGAQTVESGGIIGREEGEFNPYISFHKKSIPFAEQLQLALKGKTQLKWKLIDYLLAPSKSWILTHDPENAVRPTEDLVSKATADLKIIKKVVGGIKPMAVKPVKGGELTFEERSDISKNVLPKDFTKLNAKNVEVKLVYEMSKRGIDAAMAKFHAEQIAPNVVAVFKESIGKDFKTRKQEVRSTVASSLSKIRKGEKRPSEVEGISREMAIEPYELKLPTGEVIKQGKATVKATAIRKLKEEAEQIKKERLGFVLKGKPKTVRPTYADRLRTMGKTPSTTGQKIEAHKEAWKKALISELGKVKPQYRRLAEVMTGKTSMKLMTKEEADIFINALKKLPEARYKNGRFVPPSIPKTTKVVPKGFFEGMKFHEPTIVRYLTPQTYYSQILGVKPLVEPLELAKQKFDLTYRNMANGVDRMIKVINKVGKTTAGEKARAKVKNTPTKAVIRMRNLLNKYEEAPAELSLAEKEIFNWFRNLNEETRIAENKVRDSLGIDRIEHRKAYVRHTAAVLAKEMLSGVHPFPEGLKYWSQKVVGKKIFNPMEFHRKLSEDLEGLWTKDLAHATKAMLWTSLKEINLSQPLKFFNEQLGAVSRDEQVYKNLTQEEKDIYDLTKGVIPASTKKWLTEYVNQAIKGQETWLDTEVNALVSKTGMKGLFNKVLSPFGRAVGSKPITKVFQLFGRGMIHGVMGPVRPRQLIRNKFQLVQNLGLYTIKSNLKGFYPASVDKTLKTLMNESLFLKTYTGMEELPINIMGKIEKLNLAGFQWSAKSNVSQSMKVAYWDTMDLITNPKYKKFGWADTERVRLEYKVPNGKVYPSEREKLLKEMEFGASATQYHYVALGMPEVFRYKALVPFTRLQSWWMNYFFKFNREAAFRVFKGETGYGGKLPWSRRLGWLRYLVLGGAILNTLGYTGSYLWGAAPTGVPPTAQLAIGLYTYLVTLPNLGETWAKRKNSEAKRQMFYALKTFIPGYLAWKDFMGLWSGEKTWKEYFFYTKKAKTEENALESLFKPEPKEEKLMEGIFKTETKENKLEHLFE